MKVAIKSSMGETLATLDLDPAEFKSGSRGFRSNAKISADGRRYQVNIQAVEIGSKPKPAL